MTESGYLYVLINPSLPGLLKIGKTAREPEARAKELSQATGVATPFYVAYSMHFPDVTWAEEYLHSMLETVGCRHAANREFFRLSLESAIDALNEVRRNIVVTSASAENVDKACAAPDLGRDVYEQAMAYWYGFDDVLEDMKEALRLLDHARRLGFFAAYIQLAHYWAELHEPPDEERAIEYLKEGATRGHGRCYAELAVLYDRRRHFENAAKCWRKYFASESFTRDEEEEKNSRELLFCETGLPRLSYVQQYLGFIEKHAGSIPPDIHRMIAPLRDAVAEQIQQSLRSWRSKPNQVPHDYGEHLERLLKLIDREFPS